MYRNDTSSPAMHASAAGFGPAGMGDGGGRPPCTDHAGAHVSFFANPVAGARW